MFILVLMHCLLCNLLISFLDCFVRESFEFSFLFSLDIKCDFVTLEWLLNHKEDHSSECLTWLVELFVKLNITATTDELSFVITSPVVVLESQEFSWIHSWCFTSYRLKCFDHLFYFIYFKF